MCFLSGRAENMPGFWKEKGVSVSRLEEERVLSIFMVPVYGEDTTVHKLDSNLQEE